ncbi:5'-methylthioadenosine/adenosylhomocysteine nucleosidase [Clostridium cylindrosporum]|uniref:adenosylhomocysteine nucleosidase n=1 Tax=Clostridium cylindrosporum DSM 605 TaxID=1121307 RepID=A0A0J8D4D8_CLOCY|nr:5'-methylthioadenosine/adenosylhomocysteine nucleosidase [Clostridium cylindrosporum]KMT21025.1 5'-methylthioadenosine/S-adenosylhomocysteine nucleosidase MtnN [Clostridium cylindrosporum DSM 605]
MSIGIITAMEEELAIILKELTDVTKEVVSRNEIYRGKLGNKEVVATVCGIGKVHAAVSTQTLIREFKAEAIINVGVAGGLRDEIGFGNIVIGDSLVQHDVDTTVFGDRHGQIPRLDTFDFKADKNLVELAKKAAEENPENKTFVGRIVTGDQFLTSKEKVEWLVKEFDALAGDMESASIAHTCYLNDTPFLIIRTISDKGDDSSHEDYETNKDKAIENYLELIKKLLQRV